MNDGAKKIEQKNKIEKMKLTIMIIVFSLISFYTSYTGIIKLSGISESNNILKGFMAVLIGGLQFTLVYSVNAFYLKDLIGKYWFKTIALLLLYVITMSFSVIFSFSYWYEEFSAENYAQRNSDIQLKRVKENLINAKESFSFMNSSLISLSNYSATASNREKRQGGTCDPSVGSGEGVYTWLRADDSSYTKSYSVEIQKLQSNLDEAINKISKYIEEFDPNGDVHSFTQRVNDSIARINVKFFKNQILEDLKNMLIERSGQNRQYIVVVNRKNQNISKQSCMDVDFSIGADNVIERIRGLKPISPLEFFDVSDTQKLFGRTVGVLKVLLTPSAKIKKMEDVKSVDDVTKDDIGAVMVGFIIDFLILLIAIIAKEDKEEIVPYHTVQAILNGEYSNGIFYKLKLYHAEIMSGNLIAVPNDVNSDEVDNLKQLMLYFQQQGLVKLYVNEVKGSRLNRYFSRELKDNYADDIFRIYKMSKKQFNKFMLQNIEQGVI